MKKFLALIGSVVLEAVMALSMVACSGGALVKIIEIDLSKEQYGVAIQKGNTELAAEINDVLAQLKGDGVEVDGETVTFDSLYQAEMDALANSEQISIGDVATASSNREEELVVATNAEFAPFEYQVGDSFGGIDMQVAKILAEGMGKTLVIRHMAFESVLQSVQSGESDIAIAGLTINAERAQQVDFSDPYYDTTQRIAVAADNTLFDECKTEEDVVAVLQSLEGVSAGAAKTQTGYYYLVGEASFEFEGYSNIETRPYPTVAAAVQDLANGTIALVCADAVPLQAAVDAVNR